MAIEAELVRELLSEIVKSKPDINSNDYKWLIATLKDKYNPAREINHSDCNKEINGLGNCLIWGIVDDIRLSYNKILDFSEAKNILRKLIKDFGLTEDLSRWCIETWCIALNKHVDLNAISMISPGYSNISISSANNSQSSDKRSHAEIIYEHYIYETLKKTDLNFEVELELTIKGKQLGFSDATIQQCINNIRQQLIVEVKLEQDRRTEQLKIEAEIQRVRAQKQQEEDAKQKLLLAIELKRKNERERKKQEVDDLQKKESIKLKQKITKYIILGITIFYITLLSVIIIKPVVTYKQRMDQLEATSAVQVKVDNSNLKNQPIQEKHESLVKTQISPKRIGWTMSAHDPQRTSCSQYTGPKTNTLKWKIKMEGPIFSPPSMKTNDILYTGCSDKYTYAISSKGKIKWKTPTGEYHNTSPAIGIDGTIYTNSRDGKFFALNPSGSIKWQFITKEFIVSAPLLGKDGTIYFGSYDNKMYAINPDGSQKWVYDTKGYIMSSQAIGLHDEIYISSSGEPGGMLIALDTNGKFMWVYSVPMFGLTSPVVGKDGTIYTASNNNNLYALTNNGKLKWSYKCPDEFFEQPSIGPDGTIYIGNKDDNLYAFSPDGKLKWKFTTENDLCYTSPAIDVNGTIYIGSYDKNIYAINPNGSKKWVYKMSDKVSSSPSIGPDGTLFVGSFNGYLYAIGPGEGK